MLSRCAVAVAVMLAVAGTSRPAHADVVVNLQPGPGADFAEMLGIDLADLEMTIQNEIERAFSVLRPEDYLRAIAEAAFLSAKGLGVDYASNPKSVTFGFAGNLTLVVHDDGFDDSETDPPLAGFAPNISLMLGANLGALTKNKHLERYVVSVNVFSRKGSFDELDVRLTNFGAHGTVKLFQPEEHPKSDLVVQWGGIDITSGFEFGHISIGLDDELNTDLPLDTAAGENPVLEIDSTGIVDISARTFAVPIEVSTNLRLFYLLTLFGGVGMDIIGGTGDLEIDLDGQMIGAVGPADNRMGFDLGSADVTATASAKPRPGNGRLFGGAQLNLWRIKLFTQANVARQTVGLTIGMRAAW